MDRARQSRRDANARKAKARAKAAKQHRSWIDRKKVKPVSQALGSPMALPLAAMVALLEQDKKHD